MSIRIDLTDLSHRKSAVDLLHLLELYARDQMGLGEPLPGVVRRRLVSGLRRHPTSRVLMAYDQSRCVGVAVCFLGFSTFSAKRLVNVHDLIVDPAYRRQGVGRALLDGVYQLARKERCCRITLEVRRDNFAARKLYRRMGFASGTPAYEFWTRPVP